jgi:LuxR family maltose regulon positive regulatory protein
MAIKARLQLLQGDLEAASHWVERRGLTVDDPECISYLHEVTYLTLVRVLIALGQNETRGSGPSSSLALARGFSLQPLEDALRVLDWLLPVAEANGRMDSVIEILSLHALALQAQGNLTYALVALERALTLAEPEGYVRIFVDEGQPMAELLGRMKVREVSGRLAGYLDKLLTAFNKDSTNRVDLKDKISLQPSAISPDSFVEPLSERESEVLRLVAAGLTNQQIANHLVIALGTAKRHTINIYGKLGVNNRTQAVAKARELNLL